MAVGFFQVGIVQGFECQKDDIFIFPQHSWFIGKITGTCNEHIINSTRFQVFEIDCSITFSISCRAELPVLICVGIIDIFTVPDL